VEKGTKVAKESRKRGGSRSYSRERKEKERGGQCPTQTSWNNGQNKPQGGP